MVCNRLTRVFSIFEFNLLRIYRIFSGLAEDNKHGKETKRWNYRLWSNISGYLDFSDRVKILAVCDVLEEKAQNRAESIMLESSKRIQQLDEQMEGAKASEEKNG